MKITVIKKASPTKTPKGFACPWMIDDIPMEKK
jgi:hypothetical protein